MNGWPLDEHVWQIGMNDILSRIGVISLNMEWIYPKLRLRSWLYKVHFDSTNLLHRIRFCMNERMWKLIVSAPYSIQHSRHSLATRHSESWLRTTFMRFTNVRVWWKLGKRYRGLLRRMHASQQNSLPIRGFRIVQTSKSVASLLCLCDPMM